MTTVSFPARCAVAVICGENLVSQVYPAAIPVEVFLDDVVELLNDDLRRRGSSALDSSAAYELLRANGTRLDVSKTLDELGVEDGATLVLAPASPGESIQPQYESLSTGLARVGKTLIEPVTPHTAMMTALAILGMAVLSIVGLAARTRVHSDSWLISAVILALGALFSFGAVVVWKFWPKQWQLSGGLAWLAVPLLAGGLAAVPPGAVGSPHVFVAALAGGVLTCGLAAISGRYVTVAATIVTLCGLGGLAAAVRMWNPVATQRLAMCAMIGLLVLITAGPTIALWVARIRPPHFGSITGRDLFRRDDGMPVDAVAPVDENIDEESNLDPTPCGSLIAASARRANGVLTGICTAAAIGLPVAVWTSLMPGEPRTIGAAILALLFVFIYVSRGRAFADRRQAVALVCGGAAAFCCGIVRFVLHSPSGTLTPLVLGVLLLALFGGTGLMAALLVPATRFTPPVRMVVEWLELGAIVVALPLAAWVGGLFSWVRMR